MSEMEEFSMQDHVLDPMVAMPTQDIGSNAHTLKEIGETLDAQSYLAGEVPQQHLLDPTAWLPLNSDRLVGSVNVLERLSSEIMGLVEQELGQIQKVQKRINLWEERTQKNKNVIQKNKDKIKQNNVDITYDKKNRDYWWGRAEQVSLDYQNAAAANRQEDWSWLIKKYGLKNAAGTEIDATQLAVDELCNGETNNLISEYQNAGNQYERSKKDREAENNRLFRENASLMASDETLQSYISNSYLSEIEPLQDGILLFKELGVKLKVLSEQSPDASYGDLRSWAESFLNDFLRANPKVPQSVVTEFRKLTSIPLPPTHA